MGLKLKLCLILQTHQKISKRHYNNKCGPQTFIPARCFLAHLNGLPFSYLQQLLSEDGTKHSSGHIHSLLFQANVDSAYLYGGLELPPRVIGRHRLRDEVVKLVVDTIYSYDNILRLTWLPKSAHNH